MFPQAIHRSAQELPTNLLTEAVGELVVAWRPARPVWKPYQRSEPRTHDRDDGDDRPGNTKVLSEVTTEEKRGSWFRTSCVSSRAAIASGRLWASVPYEGAIVRKAATGLCPKSRSPCTALCRSALASPGSAVKVRPARWISGAKAMKVATRTW